LGLEEDDLSPYKPTTKRQRMEGTVEPERAQSSRAAGPSGRRKSKKTVSTITKQVQMAPQLEVLERARMAAEARATEAERKLAEATGAQTTALSAKDAEIEALKASLAEVQRRYELDMHAWVVPFKNNESVISCAAGDLRRLRHAVLTWAPRTRRAQDSTPIAANQRTHPST